MVGALWRTTSTGGGHPGSAAHDSLRGVISRIMSTSMTQDNAAHNYLLELLDAEARDALDLVRVELHAREVLHEPGMPVVNVHFPISGVVSLLSTMQGGATAEVALIGRDGMVGLAGVLGTLENPTTAVVQIPGVAFKASAASVKAARVRFPSVRMVLDRYTQARFIQVAQRAACNSLHSVEARLARWLLEADDRIEEKSITLSQELLAQILSVQRPTISVAMQRIHETGAIRYRGRAIVIADRSGLERLTCECYGVLRREFSRVQPRPALGMHSPTDLASSARGDRESPASLETMRQIAGRLLLANIREQEARDEADAANRAKDQFLAMVSHDLRAPLHAILGWCAVLRTPHSGSIERGLEVIQQNATAQLKLVEDLLDVVRSESSTLTIRRSDMNLGAVVHDVVETAAPMAADRQVTLRLGIVDELPPLQADADRIRQVLLNVVTNALQWTDVGGCVDVSVTTVNQRARVTVRDTGRGIAPDMLPHVFERFRQRRSPGEGAHGLGLGLTIARALVELHGGRIQMTSPGEGCGATCTIDLPLAATGHSR
jgi:signal transduction histidine kinase